MGPTEIKSNPLYWEKDPEKKTYEWADQIVSLFRSGWQSIVDKGKAQEGMEILLSKQSLVQLQKEFNRSSDFVANTKWVAIGVMDRIKNVLIAEFLKAAYKPQVEATDFSALQQKKSDATRLRGRRDIEEVMSAMNRRTGDPAFKVPAESFEGNIEAFDQMGLNDLDPEDRQFFMQTFHRLWHEADAQELLRALMRHNKFEQKVEDLVNDILAKNTIAFQVHASPQSGEIKWKYLKPEDCKAIRGSERDFSDAACLGFENQVTVRQFTTIAGPRFNFEKHGKMLAQAINKTNGTSYEWATRHGLWCNQVMPSTQPGQADEVRPVLMADSHQMMKYMVGISYMEWKSVDQIVEYQDQNTKLFYKKGERNNFPPTRFDEVIREFQKTYKTWFLDTGYQQQFLFNFGPLYHQLSHGEADEYSSYSLSFYQGTGKPATEIIAPFVEIANAAFYKMRWAIAESTPRIRVLHYDSIAQLIMRLAPQTGHPFDMKNPVQNIQGQINQILSHYKSSLTQLYATPEIDGQRFGGNGRPHYWDEGGLDPLAPAMQTVLDWAEAQVSSRLGVGPQDAYTPDQREGFKARNLAMQQSRNATYFVPFAIETVAKSVCTTSLNIAQDAIEFKTPTYTWLRTLIGDDSILSFKALQKIPFHSYAIYVELFNSDEKREELKLEARQAMSEGQITWDEYLVIKELDDYKKAGMILAFYRNRTQKKLQAAAQAEHARQIEIDNVKTKNQLAIIDRKGQWGVREREVQGDYYMRAHQAPVDAALQKKQMDIENNRKKMDEKADSQIKVKTAEKNLEHQVPLTPTPVDAVTPTGSSAPVDQSQGGVPV